MDRYHESRERERGNTERERERMRRDWRGKKNRQKITRLIVYSAG